MNLVLIVIERKPGVIVDEGKISWQRHRSPDTLPLLDVAPVVVTPAFQSRASLSA